jgi:hypothetical protein
VIADKFNFIKNIVEKSVVPEVAEDSENSNDMTERHQELSNYGSLGKAASQKGTMGYKHRPNKTQP